MVTINGILWIAGAGAGILLLIVLLVVFVKRKKKSPDVFEDMEDMNLNISAQTFWLTGALPRSR